jgi:hypothetical protein
MNQEILSTYFRGVEDETDLQGDGGEKYTETKRNEFINLHKALLSLRILQTLFYTKPVIKTGSYVI